MHLPSYLPPMSFHSLNSCRCLRRMLGGAWRSAHWLVPFIALIRTNAMARHCFDDVKGTCQVDDAAGWCFHNRSTGELNCDKEKYCEGVKLIQGVPKMAGCFAVQPSNNQVCCCNDANGCNISFQRKSHRSKFQRCVQSVEKAGERPVYLKSCDDSWCYSLTTTDNDGEQSEVRRGCHSRERVAFESGKGQHQRFQNNTSWMESQKLIEMPLCADIAFDIDDSNDMAYACYEESRETPQGTATIRLCCCRGHDNCNKHRPKGAMLIDSHKLKENRRRRVGHLEDEPRSSPEAGEEVSEEANEETTDTYKPDLSASSSPVASSLLVLSISLSFR